MRYSVYQRIPFIEPDRLNMPWLDFLDLVLEDLRKRLRAAGVGAYNTCVQIRAWPRSETENAKHGYDRLVPRLGLDIVMTSETDCR